MDTSKIMVEQIDILSEMEILNKRMRNIAIKDSTPEKIKAYDCGVKNAMSALESLVTIFGTEENRIIYQKYGDQSNVVRYRRLSDVLNELENNGEIKFSKGD